MILGIPTINGDNQRNKNHISRVPFTWSPERACPKNVSQLLSLCVLEHGSCPVFVKRASRIQLQYLSLFSHRTKQTRSSHSPCMRICRSAALPLTLIPFRLCEKPGKTWRFRRSCRGKRLPPFSSLCLDPVCLCLSPTPRWSRGRNGRSPVQTALDTTLIYLYKC